MKSIQRTWMDRKRKLHFRANTQSEKIGNKKKKKSCRMAARRKM